jgi:hypothetical protein
MAANAASLSEKSKSLIYPGVYGIQKKIPLWMKFYCYEFSNTASGRTITQNAGMGGGNITIDESGNFPIPVIGSKEKAQIFLPAPVNFQTNTSHKYVPEATKAMNLLPNVFGDLLGLLTSNLPPNVSNFLADFFKNVDKAINSVENGLGNLTGYESEILNDFTDAVFKNTGPSRTYDIRFNLPCLTVEDSQKAGQIIRAFEALSLPTARSLFTPALTKSFHPPLWIFGIGPIDQRRFDADWTGSTQLCVLRSVSHKKTAYETNALAALGAAGTLKPVAYSLTLSFIELEPAYRAMNPGGETSLQIINRSTVITTTGVSGVLATP